MKQLTQKPLPKIVVVRRERICNKCKGKIAKNTSAIYWHWVKASIAYSHVKCG